MTFYDLKITAHWMEQWDNPEILDDPFVHDNVPTMNPSHSTPKMMGDGTARCDETTHDPSIRAMDDSPNEEVPSQQSKLSMLITPWRMGFRKKSI